MKKMTTNKTLKFLNKLDFLTLKVAVSILNDDFSNITKTMATLAMDCEKIYPFLALASEEYFNSAKVSLEEEIRLS